MNNIENPNASPCPSKSRPSPIPLKKKVASKWRIASTATRKKIKNKTRKNLGQQYQGSSGNVSARVLGPPCSCTKTADNFY